MLDLTPEKARIFRIAHVANLAWILANGVHCKRSPTKDDGFIQIGNPELILKRATRRVPIEPGGTLDDYIPFYFTPFSPMLYNIKTGWGGIQQRPMQEIVILVSSLHDLLRHGISFVFTDRHAYLQAAEFFRDLPDLDRVDWKILQTRDFTRDPNDPGKLERYQAEALVHRHVPVSVLKGIVCHGPEEETTVRRLVQNAEVQVAVAVRPAWFFS
jgi:hypothetical protein